MRIPGRHQLTGGDFFAIFYLQFCAIGQLVALTLTAASIVHDDLTGAGNRHQLAISALYRLDVAQCHATGILDLDTADRSRPRSSATDVEGTHGQLGAGLTDGLGRNHAHRLTDIDTVTATEITTIAGTTDTVFGFTTDCGANIDLVHTVFFEHVHHGFVQQDACLDQHIVAARLVHFLGSNPPQNALAQCFHHIAAFDDGLHEQAVFRTTIFRSDNQILGHIHQSAGEVSGVGCFQRRICQTLACTVG